MRRTTKPTTFLQSPILTILVAAVCVLLVVSVVKLFIKNRETKANRDIAEAEYAEFKQKEANLEQQLQDFDSNRGIEEELRARYGVVKEGEIMITVVDNAEDDLSQASESAESSPQSNKRR